MKNSNTTRSSDRLTASLRRCSSSYWSSHFTVFFIKLLLSFNIHRRCRTDFIPLSLNEVHIIKGFQVTLTPLSETLWGRSSEDTLTIHGSEPLSHSDPQPLTGSTVTGFYRSVQPVLICSAASVTQVPVLTAEVSLKSLLLLFVHIIYFYSFTVTNSPVKELYTVSALLISIRLMWSDSWAMWIDEKSSGSLRDQ